MLHVFLCQLIWQPLSKRWASPQDSRHACDQEQIYRRLLVQNDLHNLLNQPKSLLSQACLNTLGPIRGGCTLQRSGTYPFITQFNHTSLNTHVPFASTISTTNQALEDFQDKQPPHVVHLRRPCRKPVSLLEAPRSRSFALAATLAASFLDICKNVCGNVLP